MVLVIATLLASLGGELPLPGLDSSKESNTLGEGNSVNDRPTTKPP